jgi:hypothetical protein
VHTRVINQRSEEFLHVSPSPLQVRWIMIASFE